MKNLLEKRAKKIKIKKVRINGFKEHSDVLNTNNKSSRKIN